MRNRVYTTPEALARRLHGSKPPVILDVRWTLAEPDGRPAYRAGHIPGAHYVDLETELSSPGRAVDGRHPLPRIEDLQETAREWGLNDGDSVVCYDDFDCAAASRAWWVLRWAGVKDVRILDGGFRGWAGHGTVVEGEPERPRRKKSRLGNVTLTSGHLPTITVDEAAHYPGLLIDARAPERYRGEFEPLDPRAGHIPGAINAPFTANVSNGWIKPKKALADRFGALGVLDAEEVAVYCGSGVTSTHNIAALASLGVDAALFPGSWSQWSADSTRPVGLAT